MKKRTLRVFSFVSAVLFLSSIISVNFLINSSKTNADTVNENILSITSGLNHNCVLDYSGGIWCWGDNQFGQLGDGTTNSSSIPVKVSSDNFFISLKAGGNQTCAIDTTSTLWCWGDNSYGQLATGIYSNFYKAPVKVSGNLKFKSVSLGRLHGCGIDVDDNVWCWGYGVYGQLGNGSNNWPITTPSKVSGNLKFSMITTGDQHTCGITLDQLGYCWGYNDSGQVGQPSNQIFNTPKLIPGNFYFKDISAGKYFTCGLTINNDFYCWGRNDYSQMGINTYGGYYFQPTKVDYLSSKDFIKISAGENHICVIEQGEGNSEERLGLLGEIDNQGLEGENLNDDNPKENYGSPEPQTVDQEDESSNNENSENISENGPEDGNEDASSNDLESSNIEEQDLTNEGSVQEDQENIDESSTQEPESSDKQEESFLRSESTPSVPENKTLCWGKGYDGEDGNGVTNQLIQSPTEIVFSLDFSKLSLGENHTCGLTTENEIFCFGNNDKNQSGYSETNTFENPNQIVIADLVQRPSSLSLILQDTELHFMGIPGEVSKDSLNFEISCNSENGFLMFMKVDANSFTTNSEKSNDSIMSNLINVKNEGVDVPLSTDNSIVGESSDCSTDVENSLDFSMMIPNVNPADYTGTITLTVTENQKQN